MSVMFVVVVPVVAGSWPLISAAVIAASAALGYSAVQAAESGVFDSMAYVPDLGPRSVSMVMEESEVVSDTLMRGESFQVERDGITATFQVDGRGQCNVHVVGESKTNGQLQEAGRELMDRVRQQFAYAKVMEELETRGFSVAQQEMQQNKSIRITVSRS